MSMAFEIQGMKELQDELVKFPDKLARRSLARATSSGAALVRDKAREKAKQIGLKDDGVLIRSIKMRKARSKNWKHEAVYQVYHSMTEYMKQISHLTNESYVLNYGAVYERGSWQKPTGKRVHRPHLRPALDENVPTIIEAVKQRLAKEIKVMRFEAATGQKFKKAFESQLAQY